MKVAELMHTELKTISIDSTVGDAVDALTEAQVSALAGGGPIRTRGRGGIDSRDPQGREHVQQSARA